MANDEVKDEVAELTPFDPTKKKNKKKVVIQDPADDSVDKLAEKTETLVVSDGLDFSNLKKKKKKRVQTSVLLCMVHVAPARMQTRHLPNCQAKRPPVAHVCMNHAQSIKLTDSLTKAI